MHVVAEEVSARMRNVRRANTAAEVALQTALRRQRMKFSVHESILGCRPDVVISRGRVAIFVDGDFWHGRLLQQRGLRALKKTFRSASASFWIKKIVRNAERDRRQTNRLRRHGWSVLRLWESEVLGDASAAALIVERRIGYRLRRRRHASAA